MVDSCDSCGHRPDPHDRFCSGCGLPLGHGTRAEDDSDAVGSAAGAGRSDSIELLSTADRSRPGGRAGATAGSRWSRQVATMLLVAVTSGVAVVVFRPPTETVDNLANRLAVVGEMVPDDWLAGSTASRLPVQRNDVYGPDEVNAAPVDSTDSVLERASPFQPGDLPNLSDLHLLAANQSELVRIDLATGQATAFDTKATLIGHHGTTLLFHRSRDNTLYTAPVDDPGAENIVLDDGRPISGLWIRDDGTAVVSQFFPPTSASDEESLQRWEIDLVSGTTSALPDTELSWFGDHQGLGWVPGFGVFVRSSEGGDDVLSLGAGLPMAVGRRHLLLATCQDPETCDLAWIDRSTGERVDRQVPDVNARFGSVDGTVGIDDRLVRVGDEGSFHYYFDTVTGRRHDIGSTIDRFSGGIDVEVEAVSPDGRHLVLPVGREAVFVDLQSGGWTRLPIDMVGRPVKVALVPKAAP